MNPLHRRSILIVPWEVVYLLWSYSSLLLIKWSENWDKDSRIYFDIPLLNGLLLSINCGIQGEAVVQWTAYSRTKAENV